MAKSGVVENLLSWADFKQSKDLKKTDGTKRQRITGITKLEDANDAGGRHSEKCTLILTEGDSAKALAVSCKLFSFEHIFFLLTLETDNEKSLSSDGWHFSCWEKLLWCFSSKR